MQNDRLNIRTSRQEKATIRRAARKERETVSTFVLTAALDRAAITKISQPTPGRDKTKGTKR